jgi:hypothetical protein
VVDLGLLVFLGDGGVLDGLDGLGEGHDTAGNLVGSGGGLEQLSGGVADLTLLGLVVTAGEEDKLALVLGETGGVNLELLFAGGSAAVVNGDSNGASELGGDASLLEFSKSEAATETDLTGVLAGSGRDDGTEVLNGTGELSSGLFLSLLASNTLLRGLVEVSLDTVDPVLAKVNFRDSVVMLDHC